MARADAQEEPTGAAEEAGRQIREALQDLQKNLRGILGSVIVGDEGQPIAWDLRGGVEPVLVAAAGAVLAKVGGRTADLLDMDGPRNVVLTTEQGSVAVFRVAEGATLVVLLQPTANSILVIVEVTKTLERLRGVMAGG